MSSRSVRAPPTGFPAVGQAGPSAGPGRPVLPPCVCCHVATAGSPLRAAGPRGVSPAIAYGDTPRPSGPVPYTRHLVLCASHACSSRHVVTAPPASVGPGFSRSLIPVASDPFPSFLVHEPESRFLLRGLSHRVSGLSFALAGDGFHVLSLGHSSSVPSVRDFAESGSPGTPCPHGPAWHLCASRRGCPACPLTHAGVSTRTRPPWL